MAVAVLTSRLSSPIGPAAKSEVETRRWNKVCTYVHNQKEQAFRGFSVLPFETAQQCPVHDRLAGCSLGI